MDTAPLTLFAQKVSASNRLLFADLRRLRRDILPDGITSREEVEVLLGLDHLERLDEEWPAYLVEAVTAFVLSASEPPFSTQRPQHGWSLRCRPHGPRRRPLSRAPSRARDAN